MKNYVVVEYTASGEFRGVIAGHGRNAGTWDTCMCRSSAYRCRKDMMAKHPEYRYKVELAY